MGVSFDLFGTLVDVPRPDDPSATIASELDTAGIAVPDGWSEAYRRPHVDLSQGAELSLVVHVRETLASLDIEAEESTIERAVREAFDPPAGAVTPRAGAEEAIRWAKTQGPIALCSNCSVPGLATQTLERSGLPHEVFDAVVTSIGCGYRKPAPEIFEIVAESLDVRPTELVHVGDDPATDGGLEGLGGTVVLLEDVTLESLPDALGEDH